jgi:hypothetical protein
MRVSDPVDRPVVRIVAVALTAVVVVPAALLHGYLLLWFLPEATASACPPDDLACRRDPADTVYWWLLFATIVVAVIALVLSWRRQWHPGAWWLWPVIALTTVPLGVVVATLLV